MNPQDPSPEQIEAACLLIQQTWSPAERLKRLRADWRPQVRAGDGRLCEVTASDYSDHLTRGYADEVDEHD